MTALEISASGLSAERVNINVTAMNLANIKTTQTLTGGPYQRRTTIMEAADVAEPFSKHMETALDRELRGVRVSEIAIDHRPFRLAFEPGHPDADEEGYVRYPDINVVEEMANMMTAQRGYDAGVTSIDTIKTMYNKALEIGR